jgi:toxin CptA
MRRQFKFHTSRYLAALLSAAHCAALAALLPLLLPFWAKASMSSIVLFSLAYHLWRDAWLSAPSAAVALVLEGDQVVLSTRGGEQLTGKILRGSLVTPLITVLNVLPQSARHARSAIIMRDSLDAESFRQLRVRLKWGIPNGNRSREP